MHLFFFLFIIVYSEICVIWIIEVMALNNISNRVEKSINKFSTNVTLADQNRDVTLTYAELGKQHFAATILVRLYFLSLTLLT